MTTEKKTGLLNQIPAVITIILLFASIVAGYTTLQSKVNINSDRIVDITAKIEQESIERTNLQIQLARIEEKVSNVETILEKLDAKIDKMK